MKEFSKYVKIKKIDHQLTDREVFLDLIVSLDKCWGRTQHIEEEMGLGVGTYEEPLYIIIENLLFLYYGEVTASIILWWVFNRFDEGGELCPIIVNTDNNSEQEGKEFLIKTPIQLWKLLQKINKK